MILLSQMPEIQPAMTLLDGLKGLANILPTLITRCADCIERTTWSTAAGNSSSRAQSKALVQSMLS